MGGADLHASVKTILPRAQGFLWDVLQRQRWPSARPKVQARPPATSACRVLAAQPAVPEPSASPNTRPSPSRRHQATGSGPAAFPGASEASRCAWTGVAGGTSGSALGNDDGRRRVGGSRGSLIAATVPAGSVGPPLVVPSMRLHSCQPGTGLVAEPTATSPPPARTKRTSARRAPEEGGGSPAPLTPTT